MPLKSSLRFLCAVAVAPALLLSSCVYPYYGGGYYGGPNQAAGSATGAVLGAVAGGIIGHNNCDTVGGALLGGIAGSLLGGAVGASHDRYYYGAPAPMPARGYGYSYAPPVVVAPTFGYYSGGYRSCGPRYYGRPYRSHCW